jgi:hypothetical protein
MTPAGSLLLLALHVHPATPASDVETRPTTSFLTQDPALAPLLSALTAEEGPDRLWYWGFSGGLAGVALGQSIVVATTDNRGTQINGYVNIPASALGAIAVLLTPPAAAYELGDVRAMPERTPAQREAKAAALRVLFQRSVEQERFYRSALNHALGLTVNAGLAAILYFGFKLGGRALLTLIAGSLEWETQIFTRPTAALDHAKATAHDGSGLQGIHVVPIPNGLAIAGSF